MRCDDMHMSRYAAAVTARDQLIAQLAEMDDTVANVFLEHDGQTMMGM